MANTQDLGNGLGFIYRVDTDGTTVLASLNNTSSSVSSILVDGVSKGPVGGSTVATGTVEVLTAVADGFVNEVTVNGVNQMQFSFGPTASTTEIAAAIGQEINRFTPGAGHDYTATVSGSIVTLFGPSSDPESVNGHVVDIVETSTSTFSTTDMSGGTSGGSIINSEYGVRYFYNADFGGTPAVAGDLSGSIEITANIVNRGLQGGLTEEQIVINSDNFSYNRQSSIHNIGLQAIDITVNTISPSEANLGDIIIIRNFASGIGFVKIQDNSVGSGNILTSGQASWQSDGITIDSDCIILQARADEALSGTYWVEIGRSSSLPINVTALRNAGSPTGLEGVLAVTLPVSGDTALNVDTTKRILKVTGTPTLTADVTFNPAGSPIDGDRFEIIWDAVPVIGAFNVEFDGDIANDRLDVTKPFRVTMIFNSTSGLWEKEYFHNVKANEYIEERHLGDDIVSPAKLQSDSVTTVKLLDLNVTEAKLAVGAVTNTKLGAAAVSVAKLDADLKTVTINIPISFEATEQAENKVKMPFAGTVTEIYGIVTKPIAGTDNGVMTPKDNAGTTMTAGVMDFTQSSANDIAFTTVPTANNTFAAGEILSFASTKTTAGGKALLSITIVRA